MSDLTFYGLKSCDTCRRALKALAGRDLTVIDVRADGVPRAALEELLERLGSEKLVNRRSTTWRGLDDTTRAPAETPEGAVRLLAEHPTLIKRPVIVAGDTVHVGWGPEVQRALGV